MGDIYKISEAFRTYENFCKVMFDAYALIDMEGRVIRCNPLLTQLLRRKTKQIFRASSLDDLIQLYILDELLPVKEMLKEHIPHRLDEIRGIIQEEDPKNAESRLSKEVFLTVGIHPFYENEQLIGIFLLLRDVTAEALLQDKYKVKATQSITDKLTDLYNRGYFESYFPNVIKQIAEGRLGKNLSLIIADVDHFKKINDTYGHQAGDLVLKGVAAKFKECFRKTDVVCRFGGEEFIVVLPETDASGVIQAAEKFRIAVAKHDFEFNDKKIPITISLGISQVNHPQDSPEKIISRADQALYHAKESGRNRVCIAQGENVLEIVKSKDKDT